MRYVKVTARSISDFDFKELQDNYVNHARKIFKVNKIKNFDEYVKKCKTMKIYDGVKDYEKVARRSLFDYMQNYMLNSNENSNNKHYDLMSRLKKSGVNDNHLDRYLKQFCKLL